MTLSPSEVFVITMVLTRKMLPKWFQTACICFLESFFNGENGLGETSAVASVHNRMLSISQDIIFAVTNGRKLTPKHVGLGLTVHQATRSK